MVLGESGVEEVVLLLMGRLNRSALSAEESTADLELLLMEVSLLSIERGLCEIGNGAITTSGS